MLVGDVRLSSADECRSADPRRGASIAAGRRLCRP